MNKLGELYADFSRIDLDIPGGYARVAQVKTCGQQGYPEYCAFKLMRHEIDYQTGMERFEDELRILAEIAKDNSAPSAITRIYDSGFVPVELAQSLHEHEMADLELQIISTSTDIQSFQDARSSLEKEEHGRWLPYLVVELAPYDDSLLRQIRQQPLDDHSGIYRLPTGEMIAMVFQLLDVVDYLHLNHHRAYMDWKPEHIFWTGLMKRVKLIDWNVTISLDDGPGESQNIRDDLRLLCGAALYIGLTFVDPDDPARPIGPRPTTEFNFPIPEIRRRYWTDDPDFYLCGATLDNRIKQIIKQGLDPRQGYTSVKELRMELMGYAIQELGLIEGDLAAYSESRSPYFMALAEMRQAQSTLLMAQQHLIDAVSSTGKTLEFTRLFDTIKRALMNIPGS